MKTIAITTGTRSEYGILRPVIQKIKESKKLNLILIVTGMHLSKKYGSTINEIKNDGFKITAKIDTLPKGNTNFDMSIAVGNGILEFSKIFKKFQVDINIIQGDRDEVLASAIAAYHMNIPNAHIHGGDKTSAGIDEYNRHAITKISNIHFAATKKSQERILKMGENKKYVFCTGSPSIDDIKNNMITSKKDLEKKYSLKLDGSEILLLQHPVTTQTKKSKKQINNTIKALLKTKKKIIAILPNSDAGNKEIFQELKRVSKNNESIKIFKTLPRDDYLSLLKNSKVLVGNSSSGIIDASYFSKPVVNIGIRQKGREHEMNVFDVADTNIESIYKTILKATKWKKTSALRKLYGNGESSKKIVKILETIQINDKLIQKQIQY